MWYSSRTVGLRFVSESLLVPMHSCKVEAGLVHASARPAESTVFTSLFSVRKQTPNSGSFGIAPEGECIAWVWRKMHHNNLYHIYIYIYTIHIHMLYYILCMYV